MTRVPEFNHQRKKYMYIELEILTLAVVYIKHLNIICVWNIDGQLMPFNSFNSAEIISSETYSV